MTSRFFLAHSAEVSYNDSGNINSDLTWVTSNSTVASLRNTYSADMVSLIVNNGGGYCGIGWVQRNPGSGFANYAFQVTALGCLANSTLAHEHGHNMGMEHDPASSGISPSGASYPWSFGHYVNGSFRTIMSYNVCSISCPRVLHFSNPDVLYNGVATGIADQRDNAHTGDLTAPTLPTSAWAAAAQQTIRRLLLAIRSANPTPLKDSRIQAASRVTPAMRTRIPLLLQRRADRRGFLSHQTAR